MKPRGLTALRPGNHLRLITLPHHACPLILTTLILRFMDVLRLFDVIFVMFAGGPGTSTTTLPLFVYRTTLVQRDVGRGSAASIMLIIIIVYPDGRS